MKLKNTVRESKIILTTPVLGANIAIYHQKGNTPYGVLFGLSGKKGAKMALQRHLVTTQAGSESPWHFTYNNGLIAAHRLAGHESAGDISHSLGSYLDT